MTTAPAASAPASSGSSAPSTSSSSSSGSSPSPSSSSAPSSSSGSTASPGSSAAQINHPQGSSAPDNAQGSTGTETASQKAERLLKLKVHGQELELSESEVIKRAQMAESAQQRYQEAAQMRKQTEAVLQKIRENPIAALQELGIENFRDQAEQWLYGELQRDMMDPKDRELEELRQYRQEQEDARQKAETEKKTTAEKQHMEQLQKKYQAEYEQQFLSALEAVDLPRDADTVVDVAAVMEQALRDGYEIDAQTAAEMVRDRYQAKLKTAVSKLKGDSLIKFFGDDVVKELRKHDIAVLKSKLASTNPQPTPGEQVPVQRNQPEEERKLRPAEWLEEVRRKAGV